jgi:hypothetical protein
MTEQSHTAENNVALSALETACLDGLIETPHGYRYRPALAANSVRDLVIDGMMPPPGDLDDPFWLGAQWAYEQVRNALNARVIPPGEEKS